MGYKIDKVLDAIFEQMVKEDKTTPEMENNKNKILEAVLKHFESDATFDVDQLKNDKVVKSMMGMIVSEALGLKNNTKDFMKTLTSEKDQLTDKPNPELDKKIQHGLILLGLLKKLDPSPTPKPENQAFLKEIEEVLKEQFKDDPEKKEKALNDVNEYEEQIRNVLCNLFAGDDPRVSGEIPRVLLGPILSNMNGFTAQGQADPNSTAVLIEQITYNPSKSDALGLEALAKSTDEALGVITGEAVVTDLNRPRPTFVK